MKKRKTKRVTVRQDVELCKRVVELETDRRLLVEALAEQRRAAAETEAQLRKGLNEAREYYEARIARLRETVERLMTANERALRIVDDAMGAAS